MPVVTSGSLTSGAYGTGRVGIRKFVEITADQADAMKRVNRFDTTQTFEVFKQLADFGYPKRTGEGAPSILDSRPQLYQASFTPVEYTLMFGITKVAQFTDQYGILDTYKQEMANAFADGRSLAIANLQNNGFDTTNYPGIDTVSLYNTAHPYKGYPTWSNRPSPDLTLSVTNMATAISQIRRVKTARQRPIRFRKGLILHVPPELEDLGTRIIAAKGQPQTMDLNEPNFVGTRVMTLDVDEDLTVSGSIYPWYLRAADIKQTGLFFLRQQPFDIISSTTGTGGWDPWTRTAYHSMYESYITGWIRAHGTWGTVGA